MKILSVDTSTRTGGVAILQDRTILAEVSTQGPETHAKRLMLAIETALELAGLTLQSCDGFAVTTGPGSFTGLRIGISTVKGLAFATKKPVTGVSTLDALACQFPLYPYPVCPLIDARKGQVYTALYEGGSDTTRKKRVEDCAVEPGEWVKQIRFPCLFVGDGAVMYEGLIRAALGDLARFAPPFLNTVRAAVVATIGLKQILQGWVADVADLKPRYIRKSDAEIKTGGGLKVLTQELIGI